MAWQLKNVVSAMIMTKREGNLFYEISPHAQMRFLSVDCENTKRGRREYLKEFTVLELLRMFPELDKDINLKRLLFAWEKYTTERHERKELDKHLRNELLKVNTKLIRINELIQEGNIKGFEENIFKELLEVK